MVTLYVAGRKVDWADAGRVFGERSTFTHPIELRDETGQVFTRLVSQPATSPEDDPDWVKAITPEAIEEARKGPFVTLEEYRKQAGQS